MGPPMANRVQKPAETGGTYKRFVSPYEEVERPHSRYPGHRRTVGRVMERHPGVARVGDSVLAFSLRSFLSERVLDLLKHPSLGRIPGTAVIWQGDQLRHRFTSFFGSVFALFRRRRNTVPPYPRGVAVRKICFVGIAIAYRSFENQGFTA